MALIYYGIAGEGRGHAGRALAIIEELQKEHHVIVYTSADAYQLIDKTQDKLNIELRSVPALCFSYNDRQHLDYVKSFWNNLTYLRNWSCYVDKIKADFADTPPDLIICDFEASMQRAAKESKIPFITLDHQYFLRSYDLETLPLKLRWRAKLMGRLLGMFYGSQIETIVSAFFFPPLRKSFKDVKQIGVLLRRNIIEAKTREGTHLVVYMRRFLPDTLYQALHDCGHEVHIYGLGEKPSEDNMHYYPVNNEGFIQDLAGCKALVTTAGNQLVGEALYLGKPVLGLAENGNHEQQINAHFLAQSGGGMAFDMKDISATHIQDFLDHFDQHGLAIDRQRMCGNTAALALIKQQLESHATNTATATRKLLLKTEG